MALLLRERCKAAGALLIFDEIQTGAGRLGTPLAAQYFGVEPDMVTLAKGMGSGFPVAALLVNAKVAGNVGQGDLGSTFGGGPLACAAVLATLGILKEEQLAQRAAELEKHLRDRLGGLSWLKVRGAGLLLGLEVGEHAGALKAHLFARRLIVGGSNDPGVLRLMPPLTVSDEAIERLIYVIHEFNPIAQESAG
jgi:acetylornithine/N-succinyldiaminopimelate aminotransferase